MLVKLYCVEGVRGQSMKRNNAGQCGTLFIPLLKQEEHEFKASLGYMV